MSTPQGPQTGISAENDNAPVDKSILSKAFLGNVIEQCIVTRDHKRAMTRLCKLGIGPWRVYTFTPSNTSNQTYHGKPSAFSLKVCFAELPGPHNEAAGLVYEIIEPIMSSKTDMGNVDNVNENDGIVDTATASDNTKGGGINGGGSNIFDEWLTRRNNQDGIHHIAYDCNGIAFEARRAEFERRGYKFVQGGSWMDRNHFAFFEPENLDEDNLGMVLETIAFPDDWVYPEPEMWFPCRPEDV